MGNNVQEEKIIQKTNICIEKKAKRQGKLTRVEQLKLRALFYVLQNLLGSKIAHNPPDTCDDEKKIHTS